MRYVILGGSIAGRSAAQAIRRNDASGEIVVVTAERGPAYYRPLIPLLLDGTRQEPDLTLVDDVLQHTRANLCEATVERVDAAAKTVYLSGNRKLAYDRLLIATGARPVRPKIAPAPEHHMLVLRTREDARTLGEAARNARHVVVIGGGMVGIKTATALRHRSRPPEVTVIERENHVLPLRLDRAGADIITAALMSDGIGIITGTTVAALIVRANKVTAVALANGAQVPADIVVAAIGTTPNVEFLAGSTVSVRTGVTVDAQLRTSVPDIYAAGDAVEYLDTVTRAPFVSGLWTNASEMGKIAGLNMTGGTGSIDGLLPVMNAAEICGIPFISAGIVEPGGGFESTATQRNGVYRKVVMQGDRIAGISFVGEVGNAGIYVNLIRNRASIRRDRERFLSGAATYADVAATG